LDAIISLADSADSTQQPAAIDADRVELFTIAMENNHIVAVDNQCHNVPDVAEVELPDVIPAGEAYRKRLIGVICGLIIVMNIVLFGHGIDSIQYLFTEVISDTSEGYGELDDEDLVQARIFEESLWARIIAIDQFCTDPTRKSEQCFWDTYRGREEEWYKEYRMSRSTFNQIVIDCVPFLYSRPTYSLKSARFRYLRGKVVMATLVRYLAIQSDQHTLGKEFGVRQPCVSKRLDRACRALLSAYHYDNCPFPKIYFPLEAGRKEAARWFFAKCNIPYLCGSIDGSIINIAAPYCSTFIPREFWCKRKQSYSLNLMVICDHQKRFIFADSRWPGSTADTGAVSRSKFLTNLFVRRDNTLFPSPFMILADGGFHKRACFIAPTYDARNRLERSFNTSISSARCIVENAFGLLKMKWRRLHKHSVAEGTTLIPQLILCACVLHNICIDAGDQNDEERAAVRNEEERLEERAEINEACDRILNNIGKFLKWKHLCTVQCLY
jgi:hypothetical protein